MITVISPKTETLEQQIEPLAVNGKIACKKVGWRSSTRLCCSRRFWNRRTLMNDVNSGQGQALY